MNKVKNIKLNSKDINELIASLSLLKDNIDKMEQEIPNDIAKLGLQYLNKQYENMTDDVSVEGDIRTNIINNNNGTSIVVSGKDAIYVEFGTGEIGKRNKHPEKDKYNLNDYNSGPIVSTHINNKGEHYWFYKKQYTQGIPAGKQVFNTRNYLIKTGVKKVLKEKASDVLSKV